MDTPRVREEANDALESIADQIEENTNALARHEARDLLLAWKAE